MAYPFYNYPQYPQYGAMPDQLQQYRTQNIPQQDEKIYVQGRGSAEAYLVAPGAFVRLWDTNENLFYEKRADQNGRPYMETYEYHRCDQVPERHIDYEAKIKALEERIAALEGGMIHESYPVSASV